MCIFTSVFCTILLKQADDTNIPFCFEFLSVSNDWQLLSMVTSVPPSSINRYEKVRILSTFDSNGVIKRHVGGVRGRQEPHFNRIGQNCFPCSPRP